MLKREIEGVYIDILEASKARDCSPSILFLITSTSGRLLIREDSVIEVTSSFLLIDALYED